MTAVKELIPNIPGREREGMEERRGKMRRRRDNAGEKVQDKECRRRGRRNMRRKDEEERK